VPEGDDIWRLAGRLHGALAGRTLVRTDFRVPSLANADLAGRRIDAVESRGKHILMRTDAGLTVHSHLKMDGAWLVLRTGTRARTPSHEIRAVLVTEPWTAVGSLLGILDVWPTAQERERLGHLGPDVLGSDWDPAAALRRLTADPARLVGEVLIDQRVMAGPGNVYRSEVCFLRGIDPRTPVGSVRDPAATVDLMKRLMEANRRRGARITTGDPRNPLWVYGRDTCRRCGTRIDRISLGPSGGERVAYLCPNCQPVIATPAAVTVRRDDRSAGPAA
jgi:endonuclease-8